NHLKRTPRYGWLYEVSKCAPQEALRDLDRAYQVFWQGQKAGRRGGVPRRGRVATKEPTGKFAKWGGRVLSATCRREADRWYCSLTVEVTRPDPAPLSRPGGRPRPGHPHLRGLLRRHVDPNPQGVAAEPAHPAPPFARGHPQAEGLPQPGQGHAGAGALPPEGPQPAPRRAPQGHHDAGESQVGDRAGGPACGGAGAQPPPRPRHQRPGLGGVSPPTRLQMRLVWIETAASTAILPV